MKIDILAIGAHPDDVEIACGGTIAKLIDQGKKVAILDLSKGEMGTRGTEFTRTEEAANAANILGISARENLNLGDGFLLNSKENQLDIIRIIRKYQPDVVLCNAIEDRHPDHAKGSKLASDACFLSGLIKLTTEMNGQKQQAWRPKQVFHYIQWEDIQPDFVVDITGYINKKEEACLAYKTQFYNPESNEPITAVATQDFRESLVYRAQNLGRLSGVEYAEGFTTERMLAVKNFEAFIW